MLELNPQVRGKIFFGLPCHDLGDGRWWQFLSIFNFTPWRFDEYRYLKISTNDVLEKVTPLKI